MGKKMMAYERISIFKDCRLEFFFPIQPFFSSSLMLLIHPSSNYHTQNHNYFSSSNVSRSVNIVIYGPFFSAQILNR